MEYYFSIIIATYNRADMLLETIASIQRQTFDAWQLIIVDDGSTDDTRQKVASVMADDNRIEYHYKENEERNFARNYGIPFARGKYVLFFDSDDWMLPDNLEVLHEESSCGSPIVASGISYRNENYDIKEIYEKSNHSSMTTFLCDYYHIYVPATIFRRDIVVIPFFYPDKKLVRYEDNLLLIEQSLQYPIKLISHIGFEINNHCERSVNNSDLSKYQYSFKKIFEILKDRIQNYEYTLLKEKYGLTLAGQYIKNGKLYYAACSLLTIFMKSKRMFFNKTYRILWKALFFALVKTMLPKPVYNFLKNLKRA